MSAVSPASGEPAAWRRHGSAFGFALVVEAAVLAALLLWLGHAQDRPRPDSIALTIAAPPVPPAPAPPPRMMAPPPKPVALPRPAATPRLPETPPPPQTPPPLAAVPPPPAPEPTPPLAAPTPMAEPQTHVAETAKPVPVPARVDPTPPAPPPVDLSELSASYNARLSAAVQAAFVLPATARQMGFHGKARLEFHLRDGIVSGARILLSSSLGAVDRAALAAVQGAAFPAPPAALSGKDGVYQIWVACF